MMWNVAASTGLGFEIVFRAPFHVEPKFDSLTFGKGVTPSPDTRVVIHSGAEQPSPLLIDSREIWIRFQSDENKSAAGFYINITALNFTELRRCGKGHLLRPHQVCDVIWDCQDGSDEAGCDPIPPGGSILIAWSDVTSAQSRNLRMTWTITASGDQSFHLEFVEFQTEEGLDLLQVGGERDCSHVFDYVFSGSGIPDPVTLTNQSLCLHYKTDYSNPSRGFVVNVTTISTEKPVDPGSSVCGGRPAEGLGSRIIGGSDATLGDWPWIGSIKLESGGHLCSAILIHPEWALTAGHCIGRGGHMIAFGNAHLSGDPKTEQSFAFSAIRHPDYSRATFKHDISLLRLNDTANVTNHVRPICLAATENEVLEYEECLIAGWGITDFRSAVTSEILQEAAVPLIDETTCNQYIGSIVQLFPRFMICAGFQEGGVDSCEGDSGGPLMCRNTSSDGWDLVGITSFGIFCAFPERPGIYTRISTHLDFIRELHTQPNE